MQENPSFKLTRREVLIAGASSVAAGGLSPALAAVSDTLAPPKPRPPVMMPVTFRVNGTEHRLEVDTRMTLLDALRERLRLTGSKKGCDHGQCGACTVIADGRRINACLSLAVMHEGAAITTIEGLGTPQALHPMQRAFVTQDGYQCGYCTPGQICSAVAVLAEIEAGVPSHVSADLLAAPQPTVEELRERMSGNLCRCGAYSNILDAMSDVAQVRP